MVKVTSSLSPVGVGAVWHSLAPAVLGPSAEAEENQRVGGNLTQNHCLVKLKV